MSLAAQTPQPQEPPEALIHRILSGAEVKPESYAALLHALFVAQNDGVGGTLVVKIPRKRSAPTEVTFVTGSVSMRIES